MHLQSVMNEWISFGIQIALFGIPLVVFHALWTKCRSDLRRLGVMLILSMVVGATAYYLAASHGWIPPKEFGGRVTRDPLELFLVDSVGVWVGLCFVHWRQKRTQVN